MDAVFNVIYNNFNNSLFSSNFPSYLQNATITPNFKKKDRVNVENYRAVSIFLNLSKVHEGRVYIQIYKYLNKTFSKSQSGFCQGYSAQHYLFVMVEKWRHYLDNGGVKGALLTDLSKGFKCILRNFLIAKLAAYGFDNSSLQMLRSYL